MAETASLTIDLPREYLEQLSALALSTNQSMSALAGEALVAYLDLQQWQVEAIREAIEEADSGAEPIEHEAVAAWLRSWGTDDELPPPR